MYNLSINLQEEESFGVIMRQVLAVVKEISSNQELIDDVCLAVTEVISNIRKHQPGEQRLKKMPLLTTLKIKNVVNKFLLIKVNSLGHKQYKEQIKKALDEAIQKIASKRKCDFIDKLHGLGCVNTKLKCPLFYLVEMSYF